MRRKPTIEEQMIESLKKRKEQYEEFFNSGAEAEVKTDSKGNVKGPEMDNPATTAYTGLIKAIVELSKKATKESKNPEELKRIAAGIFEKDYGVENG